tara:strand:- start:2009 stop:2851 length:843 start_codon:yes stop_codon:yes gene_type:complete
MSTENDSRNLLDELETLQRVLDDAAGEQIDLERALTQLNTVDEVPVLSDLFSRDEPPALRNINKPGNRPSHLSAVKTPPTTPAPAIISGDILEHLRQEMLRKHATDHSTDTLDALLGPIDGGHSAADGLMITPFNLSPAATPAPPAANHLPDLKKDMTEADIPTLTDRDTDNSLHIEPSAPAASPAPAITAKISSNPFLPQSVLDRLTSERLAAQHSAEEAHRTMQRVMEQKQQRDSEAISRLETTEKNQLIESLVDELTLIIQTRLREKLRNILMAKPR